MGKNFSNNHTFDVESFTNLLIKAQGERSQTKFANDCGLSIAYMCKYLNKRCSKPPTPKTLKKISNTALGEVTYYDLLQAAGYDTSEFTNDIVENVASNTILEFKKLSMATITASLAHSKFNWSSRMRQNENSYDFEITINEGKISKWLFFFFPESHLVYQDTTRINLLMSYYGRFTLENHSPRTKISFVTNNKNLFEELINHSPYMLSMFVSIILIDTNTLEIVEEKYLHSALSLHPDLETIYKLK